MMSSNQKGAIAETWIAAEALELGCTVYRPTSEGCRYDLIIDSSGRLLRVQCKWASLKGAIAVVYTITSRLTPHGYVRTTYQPAEIDGIAAYCHALKRCFWLPIEEVAGKSVVHLRLQPARNGQQAGLTWADDYPLGAIAQLGERRHGMAEAGGSSPPSSTSNVRPLR
jgi:PD-(D/E)XK endonuclease